MASQFVVKSNQTGGYDVYMRDLITHQEYAARFTHLTMDCQFSPDEAAKELYHMVGQFLKKTETKNCPLSLCEQYVWDYATPGDIVQLDKSLFVVNRPAKEIQ